MDGGQKKEESIRLTLEYLWIQSTQVVPLWKHIYLITYKCCCSCSSTIDRLWQSPP